MVLPATYAATWWSQWLGFCAVREDFPENCFVRPLVGPEPLLGALSLTFTRRWKVPRKPRRELLDDEIAGENQSTIIVKLSSEIWPLDQAVASTIIPLPTILTTWLSHTARSPGSSALGETVTVRRNSDSGPSPIPCPHRAHNLPTVTHISRDLA
jgi:hypothetical protein